MEKTNPELIRKIKKSPTIELVSQEPDLGRQPKSGKKLESEPLLDDDQGRNSLQEDMVSVIGALKIHEKILTIKKYSSSLNQLIWIFIAANLFTNVILTASQKYIQYNLQGEASDLVNLITFQSMAVLFTPFFGILMDKFYPMKLRVGPYLILTELTQVGCLSLIGMAKLSKGIFMFLLALYTCGNILTVAITQAVLAMKTKLDIEQKQWEKQLKDLEQRDQEQGGGDEGEFVVDSDHPKTSVKDSEAVGIGIYATFQAFSSIFGGISPVIAGLLVDYLPEVKQAFLVTMTPNIVLLIFATVFFKEKKQKTSFPKGKSVKDLFSGTFKVITSKSMLLPILLVMLIKLTPSMSQAINFITINQVGWSYTQAGAVSGLKTIVIAGILIQLQRLSKLLSFDIMVFTGVLSLAVARMAEVPLGYPVWTGIWYVLFTMMYGIFFEFVEFFNNVALSGRLNILIPKGLEASATNTLRALAALNGMFSGVISSHEMTFFGVKGGYYGRIKGPLILNLFYGVLIVAVSSLFLLGTRELTVKKKGEKELLEK